MQVIEGQQLYVDGTARLVVAVPVAVPMVVALLGAGRHRGDERAHGGEPGRGGEHPPGHTVLLRCR